MPVVVRYRYPEQPAAAYETATRYVVNALDGGGAALDLYDAKGNLVATHAPGDWSSAEVLPDPVDPAVTEARDRAKRAMEQALIFEGWTPPGGFESASTIAAAAEAAPMGGVIPVGAPLTVGREAREAFVPAANAVPAPEPQCPCRDHAAVREAVETTTELTATLGETSEPYVSVSTSVSGNDADEVGRLLRDVLKPRDVRVVVDTSPEAQEAFVKFLRKAIRMNGAKSFGLKPDDDGPAGVREPVRP